MNYTRLTFDMIRPPSRMYVARFDVDFGRDMDSIKKQLEKVFEDYNNRLLDPSFAIGFLERLNNKYILELFSYRPTSKGEDMWRKPYEMRHWVFKNGILQPNGYWQSNRLWILDAEEQCRIERGGIEEYMAMGPILPRIEDFPY